MKPQINTDTLTSYGVECLLCLKGMQVTQIFRQRIRVYRIHFKSKGN